MVRYGVGAVFEVVNQNLSAAGVIAEDLGLTEIQDFVRKYCEGVRLLEAWYHKARVDMIFQAAASAE